MQKKTKMMRSNYYSTNDMKSQWGSIKKVDDSKNLGGWVKCSKHEIKPLKALVSMVTNSKICKSSFNVQKNHYWIIFATLKFFLFCYSETWYLTSLINLLDATFTKSLEGLSTAYRNNTWQEKTLWCFAKNELQNQKKNSYIENNGGFEIL